MENGNGETETSDDSVSKGSTLSRKKVLLGVAGVLVVLVIILGVVLAVTLVPSSGDKQEQGSESVVGNPSDTPSPTPFIRGTPSPTPASPTSTTIQTPSPTGAPPPTLSPFTPTTPPISVNGASFIARLIDGDGTNLNHFGNRLAIDGDYMAVGPIESSTSNQVAGAFILNRSPFDGSTWAQQSSIEPPPSFINKYLFRILGMSGDYILVGSPTLSRTQCNFDGAMPSHAYVYVRSGNTWTEQAKLTWECPDASNFQNRRDGPVPREFARNGAMDGDYIVIGHESGVTLRQGAAHVYARIGSSWIFQTTLTSEDFGQQEQWSFGALVDISGQHVVVAGRNSGSVYVYSRSAGSTTTWSPQTILSFTDIAVKDNWSVSSIAMDGNTILVGFQGGSYIGPVGGAVYVFTRSSNGSTWSQTAKLVAQDGKAGDRFGASVAIFNGIIVVGAPGSDVHVNDDGLGAAYIFSQQSGGTSSWVERIKLVAQDGGLPPDIGAQFGERVAISGKTVLVGSPDDDRNSSGGSGNDIGSSYIFELY